jgi:MoaA/NifB/PqqE/SkfB family radical SAM enzyme
VHHVFVGFDCNNRCRFCAQGDLRGQEAGDLVDEGLAGVTPGSAVAFVGGEPTVHDALPRWIGSARARGARVVLLQTNGRRLVERGYAALLRDAGLERLDVSLHGSTAAMHDYHTGSVDSFSQTTRGLRQARASGLLTAVTVVVTRSNYRHLAEIVRLSHGLGVQALHLALAEPLGTAAAHAPSIVPPRALVRPHWARALATARALSLPCLAGRQSPIDQGLRDRFAGLGIVSRPQVIPAPA